MTEPTIVMTPLLIQEMLDEAFKAASEATQEYLDAHPDEWYPCGFAWVNLKPARGPVVAALKARNAGYSDTYYGGYTTYNPSGNPTQSMMAKEAGAKAFQKVLAARGIKTNVGTRMD